MQLSPEERERVRVDCQQAVRVVPRNKHARNKVKSLQTDLKQVREPITCSAFVCELSICSENHGYIVHVFRHSVDPDMFSVLLQIPLCTVLEFARFPDSQLLCTVV